VNQVKTPKPWARGAIELLVIVAGVLIALAADRWILAQEEAGLEREYLIRLASDLRRDSTNQSQRAEQARATYDRGERVLTAIREGSGSVENPGRFLTEIPWIHFHQYRIDYATETWDELGSTGNLALIQGSEFRRLLGEYQGEIEFFDHLEASWLNARDQWSQVTLAALPPEILVESQLQFHLRFIEDNNIDRVPATGLDPVFDDGALASALARLANDARSVPTLSEILMNSVSQVVIYEGLVQRSTELLRLVDTMIPDAP